MSMYRIPLSYNPIDVSGLTEVLNKYEGEHHNRIVLDFEQAFKTVVGADHAVALNSGTSAIHLALKVLGIGPGDCVVAPTFTYVATINPILYVGATPIFIDSEAETWNMDPALLEEAIRKQLNINQKPKAIIIVHTYGMPGELTQILKIASEFSIPVIEDAAESLGSRYLGTSAGLLGDIGIFSFNNNKVITTYGGGVLVSKNLQFVDRARFLASQARENLPYYDHREVGFNYGMNPLGAAYGLSQLPRLEQEISLRRRVFDTYFEEFAGKLAFQTEKQGRFSNRWFTALLFQDQATNDRITSVLRAHGIETRPLWRPMHQQRAFHAGRVYGTILAEEFFRKGICLPSGGNLSNLEIGQIVELIRSGLKG
jgi:dTDP-4-amino-4,6-dideoxygalactose transaminase